MNRIRRAQGRGNSQGLSKIIGYHPCAQGSRTLQDQFTIPSHQNQSWHPLKEGG